MAELELLINKPYSSAHPEYEEVSGASKVITKSGGRITKVEFYRSYDPDTDILTGLFCKEEYNYSGSKLISVTVTWYASDGITVDRTETIQYQTDGDVTRELHFHS